MESIPTCLKENKHELTNGASDIIKTLGLTWLPISVELQVTCELKVQQQMQGEQYTKRTVLATISSIFDPLGLMNAIVIRFKIFMQ